MAHALINTLEYVKLLTQAGFNQREAEGLNKAQMMATEAIVSQVATREDLKDLRNEMQNEFKNVRVEMQTMAHELRAEIKAVEHRLEAKIDALRPFVYRVMVTIMLANLTIIGLGMGALALFLKQPAGI